MNPQQIRLFLKHLATDVEEIKQSGKWVAAPCPLAPWTHDNGTDSNPSFAINCNPKKESVFNCYTCEKGDLLYLVQLLKKFEAPKPKYNLKAALDVLAEEGTDGLSMDIKDFDSQGLASELTLPWDEAWLDTFMKAVNVPIAMEYLNGRTVAEEVVSALDIRWDGSRECVSFPVRDWEGRLCGLRGRRLSGGYYDYGGPQNHRNKLCWYGEQNLDTNSTVLMVESVFDYASAIRVFANIAAPLTVGMSKAKIQRMEGCLDIVTLFDNGKGGDKARKLVDKYLPSAVKVHCHPPKHCSDPGDMQVHELCNVLNGKLKLGVAIS